MCVNKVALDSAAAGIEPAISSRKFNTLTTTPPSHTRTCRQVNGLPHKEYGLDAHCTEHLLLCRWLLTYESDRRAELLDCRLAEKSTTECGCLVWNQQEEQTLVELLCLQNQPGYQHTCMPAQLLIQQPQADANHYMLQVQHGNWKASGFSCSNFTDFNKQTNTNGLEELMVRNSQGNKQFSVASVALPLYFKQQDTLILCIYCSVQ